MFVRIGLRPPLTAADKRLKRANMRRAIHKPRQYEKFDKIIIIVVVKLTKQPVGDAGELALEGRADRGR
jgi:hypothetical protein